MKKILLPILFTVTAALSAARAASEQSEAIGTAKAYAEAMRTHNYSALVDLAPKPLVKVMGGKDKMIAALRADPSMSEVAFQTASFSGEPQKIEATDAVLYLVKADVTAIHREKTRILLHTFYIVFRFKDESGWNVLDGSTTNAAKLGKLFRGLPPALSLPQVTADVLTEEPKAPPP